MRTLEGHKVNGANEALTIHVADEPGSGGAHHAYIVFGANAARNPSMNSAMRNAGELEPENLNRFPLCLLFQNGPIQEAGVNGLTHEALLAILIDRLECFQAGPFASNYNACALDGLHKAQDWLQQRTRDRLARNVEGTHTP